MGRTEIRGGQIKDDSITGDDIDESTLVLDKIRDADGDTKVQVEESADGDKIRFDTAGVERMIITDSGAVGIGATNPSELLTINAANDGAECFIKFEEAGADRAKVGINTSNNLVLHNQFTNKHIVMKINDNGVTKEGFRLNGAIPEVVVNESSESLVNFRVESDSNTHMLYVTGSGRVGVNTSAPVCELDINGTTRTKAFGVNVRDVNATSSVQAIDYCLRCVQTGAITITLPAKAQNVGRVLVFKDALGNAASNNITIDGDGSDQIDGATTYIINNNKESVTLTCDGINGWMITSKFAGEAG